MTRGRLSPLVDFRAHVQPGVHGVLRGTYEQCTVVEQRVPRVIRNGHQVFLPGRFDDRIPGHRALEVRVVFRTHRKI